MRGVSAQSISAQSISTPSPEQPLAGLTSAHARPAPLKALRSVRAGESAHARPAPPTAPMPGTGWGAGWVVCACSVCAYEGRYRGRAGGWSAHARPALQTTRRQVMQGKDPAERRSHVSPPPALMLILAVQGHCESRKIISIDFYHSPSYCAVLVLNASGWHTG